MKSKAPRASIIAAAAHFSSDGFRFLALVVPQQPQWRLQQEQQEAEQQQQQARATRTTTNETALNNLLLAFFYSKNKH